MMKSRYRDTHEARFEVRIFGNACEMACFAAQEFTRIARSTVKRKGKFSTALSGGDTPRLFYSLLGDNRGKYLSRIPWENVQVFWGDERFVPASHPESNYRMAQESFLAKVPVPHLNVHRIRQIWLMPKRRRGCMMICCGVFLNSDRASSLPFDLFLLGLGSDGHIASLFRVTRL